MDYASIFSSLPKCLELTVRLVPAKRTYEYTKHKCQVRAGLQISARPIPFTRYRINLSTICVQTYNMYKNSIRYLFNQTSTNELDWTSGM